MMDQSPRKDGGQGSGRPRTTEKRFPARLYSVGEEPDPRFTLANERTFLAWIRTGAALLALAGALLTFEVPVAAAARWSAALVLALGAVTASVWGWAAWMRTESSLRTKTPLPGLGGGGLLAVVLLIAVVILALGAATHALDA